MLSVLRLVLALWTFFDSVIDVDVVSSVSVVLGVDVVGVDVRVVWSFFRFSFFRLVSCCSFIR